IPAEWEEWARARGVAPPALDEALWFDTQEQVVQVAEAGHGLALGRTPYIDARLAEGRLVAPYGAAGPTGAAYYLCHAEGVAPVAAALRLADWLLSEAQT
ncbi:MAG: LysR substrate-binding domain-containing protein, partial [Pseudomonadota bacterium]